MRLPNECMNSLRATAAKRGSCAFAARVKVSITCETSHFSSAVPF